MRHYDPNSKRAAELLMPVAIQTNSRLISVVFDGFTCSVPPNACFGGTRPSLTNLFITVPTGRELVQGLELCIAELEQLPPATVESQGQLVEAVVGTEPHTIDLAAEGVQWGRPTRKSFEYTPIFPYVCLVPGDAQRFVDQLMPAIEEAERS